MSTRRPTVEQMADEVDRWLDDCREPEREAFIHGNAESLGFLHHSLGMRIRNHFSLWSWPWQQQLDDKLADRAPEHPDAISMRVLLEVWRRRQKAA